MQPGTNGRRFVTATRAHDGQQADFTPKPARRWRKSPTFTARRLVTAPTGKPLLPNGAPRTRFALARSCTPLRTRARTRTRERAPMNPRPYHSGAPRATSMIYLIAPLTIFIFHLRHANLFSCANISRNLRAIMFIAHAMT